MIMVLIFLKIVNKRRKENMKNLTISFDVNSLVAGIIVGAVATVFTVLAKNYRVVKR